MYGHWGRDDQMGKDQMSKQLVPSQFGEERNDTDGLWSCCELGPVGA